MRLRYEELRRVALDRSRPPVERLAAIEELVRLNSRDAVEALLDIGGGSDDLETVLRAAGHSLATLNQSGEIVSNWDIRDLGEPAADAFLE